MSDEELEEIIEKARIDRATRLDLSFKQLTNLPESIGNLSNLTVLYLSDNQLANLPESIGNLSNLTVLNLIENKITKLPESIGNLSNLSRLWLSNNQLTSLPTNITKLTNLNFLRLSSNRLIDLPKNIGDLSNLKELFLDENQITKLPLSLVNILNLYYLNLSNNPINDLCILQGMPNLGIVDFCGAGHDLNRKYWNKFSEWEPEWFLNEENAEIRRIIIQQVGYERICNELNAVKIDSWREYCLLRIDGAKTMYRGDSHYTETRETLVFLKMTCPSTGHIHILRVPPEMTSAEVAITWVNNGIHPDEFAVQT